MRHLLWAVAIGVLVGLAVANPAEARKHRQSCWDGPSGRATPHAPKDFVANRLNRAVLGQVRGGLGQVDLNPQPLPP